MKNQIYNVTLIPPDLRREETIKQIADSLDYLNQIANDIFKRISTKVAENKTRLKSINDRTIVAQMKIDKIKGSNKATKVFCSAKYPGSENYDYYKSVFPAENNIVEIKRSSQPLHSKHPAFDDKILKEKLQFYNLRWHINKQNKYEQTIEEGLGQLPRNLTSVSSLLLFNTSENPYKKYVMLDPLGAVTKTRKALAQDDDDEGMGAAPLSIIQREELEHHMSENYFYNPGLGEVPEIDVPLDLPDLPGIADDLAYSADIGPTIAPSVPGSNLPVLPAIIPDLPSPSTMEIAPPPLINSSSSSTTAPPPPPPSVPPPPPFMEPPPPPPPPPPVATVEEPQESAQKVKKIEGAPAEVTQPGDARANLLESIRQAGGKATLRSVQDRKIEAKKKKKEEKATGGGTGDLMADLYAKLSMRRKGISGARTGSTTENFSDGPSLTNNSAMDRISAMIPPPPKPSHVDEPTEDEDWN